MTKKQWLLSAAELRTATGELYEEGSTFMLYRIPLWHDDLRYSNGYQKAREAAASICESLAYDGMDGGKWK